MTGKEEVEGRGICVSWEGCRVGEGEGKDRSVCVT